MQIYIKKKKCFSIKIIILILLGSERRGVIFANRNFIEADAVVDSAPCQPYIWNLLTPESVRYVRNVRATRELERSTGAGLFILARVIEAEESVARRYSC